MIKKIVRNDQEELIPEMMGADIPKGETFMGKISNYPDWLFLRTHSGIVSLNNPELTWTLGGAYIGPAVENYVPVDITIYVQRKG